MRLYMIVSKGGGEVWEVHTTRKSARASVRLSFEPKMVDILSVSVAGPKRVPLKRRARRK